MPERAVKWATGANYYRHSSANLQSDMDFEKLDALSRKAAKSPCRRKISSDWIVNLASLREIHRFNTSGSASANRSISASVV